MLKKYRVGHLSGALNQRYYLDIIALVIKRDCDPLPPPLNAQRSPWAAESKISV